MNQQNFDNPRAFAPTNKYDFIVTVLNVSETTCIHAAFKKKKYNVTFLLHVMILRSIMNRAAFKIVVAMKC